MFRTVSGAFSDVSSGFRLRRVWLALAEEDIGDQHRRTALGPAWLLVNYLVYIGTLLLVFGSQSQIPNFTAYVSVGMLIFLFAQDVILQSIALFIREKSLIAGTTLPLSVYVFRLTMQSLIRTGYAALGCLAILLIGGTPVTLAWIWSLLGIAILLVIAPAIIVIFAMAGAFFPDLEFVVSNLIRVSVFLTPVFWIPSTGFHQLLYKWNPLTYFIEVVREPIVAGAPPILALEVCAVITVACWIIAAMLLGRFRKQIVFLL